MRHCVGLLALFIALPVFAGSETTTGAGTEVKVELVKPKKEKLPGLRFLSENRDVLRSRMDILRQVPVRRDEKALEMNERFLTYQAMLAGLAAARDTMDVIDKVEEQEFLTSVTQLGDLE